jgi:hypothetical protein
MYELGRSAMLFCLFKAFFVTLQLFAYRQIECKEKEKPIKSRNRLLLMIAPCSVSPLFCALVKSDRIQSDDDFPTL